MITPTLQLINILVACLNATEQMIGQETQAIQYAHAEIEQIKLFCSAEEMDPAVDELNDLIARRQHLAEVPITRVPWIQDMNQATREGLFIYAFSAMAQAAHANAVAKWFWVGGVEAKNIAEMIALKHSELSEALEAFRNGNPPDPHVPGFDSASVEFADCIIRIMDTAAAYGLPVAEAIVAKMRFNATRPAKHGKAF